MPRPALDPVTALFGTAHRYPRIGDGVTIGPGHPGLQRAGDAVCAAKVLRPHPAAKPVCRIVGQSDDLVLAVEGNYRKHRAENFLARNPHRIVDIGEHRWGNEESVGQRAAKPLAARYDSRAIGLGDIEIAGHLGELHRGSQRPELARGIEARSDLERAANFGDPLDKSAIDRTFNKQARARVADLSGVHEAGHRRALSGLVEIGVGEDNVRRLAAKFHRDPLHVDRRSLNDLASSDGRAGERNLVDIPVRSQRGPGGRPWPRHDINYALGHPGFVQDFRHHQRRKRRFLGRFEHQCAACRQHRADAPKLGNQRPVPRNDPANHAQRQLERIAEEIARHRIGQDVAPDVGRLPGVKTKCLLDPAAKR